MQPDLISVLFPSRSRPAHVTAAVASLPDRAACPEAVEILVAADPDDEVTQRICAPQTRIWTAPERYWYKGLHLYYNTLAGLAGGVWLLIWNDDASMNTAGWDQVIRAEPPGILWAESCNPAAPPGAPSEFPALPAAWARHLGHVSLHFSVDMWVDEIGLLTGTGRHVPITLTHAETPDVTTGERDTSGTAFWAPEMVQAREADAQKIRQLTA